MNNHAKGQFRITLGVMTSLLMVASLLAACGGAQVEPTPAGPPTLPPPVLRMLVNPPEPEALLEIDTDEIEIPSDTESESATDTAEPDTETAADEADAETTDTEATDTEATDTATDTESTPETDVTAESATPTDDELTAELTTTPEDEVERESDGTDTATPDAEADDETTAEPTVEVVEQPIEIDYPAAEEALERALHEQTGLSVDIQIVERSADALNTLCNLAATDLPTIAWLDGLTYLVAAARECGQPSLQISRGDATGQAGQIIIDRQLGTQSLTVIASRTYCRLGYTDLYTWLLPSIALKTVNIDLTQDVELRDLPDLASLVDAVVEGECTMTGIAEGTLERLGIDESDVAMSITTPPLPYGVLVFAPEVELGVRLGMERILAALSESPEGAALLWPFLAQDALLPIAPDDFADLRDFVDESGLNLAQLGE